MRKLLIGLAAFLLAASVSAQTLGILCPTDTLQAPLYLLDSVGGMTNKSDTLWVIVTAPDGGVSYSDVCIGPWVGDTAINGTKWKLKKRALSATQVGSDDTTHLAYVKVSDVIASATRYGMYGVHAALHSTATKAKMRSINLGTFQYVRHSIDVLIAYSVDSLASASLVAKLSADSVLFRDSTRSVAGGAHTFGYKGMQDISATFTLSSANLDSVASRTWHWPINGFTGAMFALGQAGAYQRLAGDSTTFENSLEVWKHRFDTVGLVAGSIGDSLNNPSYVGNVYTIGGSTDIVSNQGREAAYLRDLFRPSGSGAPMRVSQMDVGGAAGANGAIYAHNSTGPAIYGLNSSVAYPAVYFYNNAAGASPGLQLQGGSNGGAGLTAYGSGPLGDAIHLQATGTGRAIYGASVSGPAGTFTSSLSDGMQFLSTGGNGAGLKAQGNGSGPGGYFVSGATGYGLWAAGTGAYGIYARGQVNGLAGYGVGSNGIAAASGTSAVTGFGGVMDSVAGVGGGGGGGGADTVSIKAAAANNPSLFYGPTNAGTGSLAFKVFVVDTSATPDVPLFKAKVTVQDTFGTTMGAQLTPQNGLRIFALDAGTYRVLVFDPPYSFASDTFTITTNDSIQVSGYLSSQIRAGQVQAYVDVSNGIVDSLTGLYGARTSTIWTLSLISPGTALTDGSTAFIPTKYAKVPDIYGKTTFFVPANTILTPKGSYYVLDYVATDGMTSTRGTLRRFVLDTSSVPVNIMAARQR